MCIRDSTTGYRSVERSYQEAKSHEVDGKECDKLKSQDLDGKEESK